MTIYPGDRGDAVRELQAALVKAGFNIAVDGIFGVKTKDAVMKFQRQNGLSVDGIAGPETLGVLFGDDGGHVSTAAPFPPMSAKRRAEVFGTFKYRRGSGDSIVITDGWERENIVSVFIPQLKGLPFYRPGNKLICDGNVNLHRKAAPIFKEFFALVESQGLLDLVRSFDGAWVPRFQRGPTSALSNHAWGTAIDINCYANPLGKRPAPRGADGSVIDLVPLAHSCGLYWGGNFGGSRVDGMHFEVAVVT